MAMGGFSGSDPILQPEDLARLVADGTVRFFLLQTPPNNRPGGAEGQDALTDWVERSCRRVTAVNAPLFDCALHLSLVAPLR